jgi:hypothetical protein
MSRPTQEQITAAVLMMAEVIPFFPRTQLGQSAVVAALSAFVGTSEQLAWLAATACNGLRRWEGIAELRAIYATRFDPADGTKAGPCTTPGLTPADLEARHFDREVLETEQRLIEYRRQNLLAPPADPESPQILTARSTPARRSTPRLCDLEAELAQAPRQHRTPEETAKILAEIESRLQRCQRTQERD